MREFFFCPFKEVFRVGKLPWHLLLWFVFCINVWFKEVFLLWWAPFPLFLSSSFYKLYSNILQTFFWYSQVFVVFYIRKYFDSFLFGKLFSFYCFFFFSFFFPFFDYNHVEIFNSRFYFYILAEDSNSLYSISLFFFFFFYILGKNVVYLFLGFYKIVTSFFTFLS